MTDKTLIVYYSLSGKSEVLAKALQAKLGCDADKIDYAAVGTAGYRVSFFKACFEAICKRTVSIKGDIHNPADYERLILISPVWGGALSTPVRSYLTKNKAVIKNYSLLVTCGGGGLEGAVKDAEKTLEKSPALSRQFLSAQIDRSAYYIEDL